MAKAKAASLAAKCIIWHHQRKPIKLASAKCERHVNGGYGNVRGVARHQRSIWRNQWLAANGYHQWHQWRWRIGGSWRRMKAAAAARRHGVSSAAMAAVIANRQKYSRLRLA